MQHGVRYRPAGSEVHAVNIPLVGIAGARGLCYDACQGSVIGEPELKSFLQVTRVRHRKYHLSELRCHVATRPPYAEPALLGWRPEAEGQAVITFRHIGHAAC